MARYFTLLSLLFAAVVVCGACGCSSGLVLLGGGIGRAGNQPSPGDDRRSR